MKKTTKSCPNCEKLILENAVYCSKCGQKYFNGKISIKDIFRDFIDNTLNFDFSVFRTLKTIIFPGRLTIKYFKGKHKTYANPFRIFFISIIPLLAVSTLGINNSISTGTNLSDAFSNLETKIKLNEAIMITKDRYNEPIVDSALDTLQVYFLSDSTILADSIDVQFSTITGKFTTKMSTLDLKTLKIEDLKEKYDIKTTLFQDILLNQFLLIFQKKGSLDNLINYFLGKLNWLIILIMPLIAAAYKLVYIRREKFYIEHLVFNLHIHSFAFIIILLQILVNKLFSIDVSLLITLGLFIYFIFALKNYYQQTWVKTLLKTSLIGLLYIGILSISFTVYALVGLFLI